MTPQELVNDYDFIVEVLGKEAADKWLAEQRTLAQCDEFWQIIATTKEWPWEQRLGATRLWFQSHPDCRKLIATSRKFKQWAAGPDGQSLLRHKGA